MCSVIGLLAASFFAWQVMQVEVVGETEEKTAKFIKISNAISEGAMAFLQREYVYVGVFSVAFAGLIAVLLDEAKTPEINEGIHSAIAFLFGAFTSSLCAFLGMKIATLGNVRTTIRAQKGLAEAFKVAFGSGAVMGFSLVAFALLGLVALYLVYSSFVSDVHILMEIIAGFGLGGSSVALFGRVGGGIYTKAADVGADLVGKVEAGIPEDDPRNPATIADNVGDNVGDIAGMGADLFGSCAEATCAALVIGASSAVLADNHSALLYPVLISALGIPGKQVRRTHPQVPVASFHNFDDGRYLVADRSFYGEFF